MVRFHSRSARIGRRRALLAATATGAAAWLAACGGDDKPDTTGNSATTGSVTAGSATTTGAAATATATAQPRSGGALRLRTTDDIVPRLAPHVLGAANIQMYNLVFDRLADYDSNLTPRPRMAASWEWAPDYQSLAIKIRPGVTFHSGRPFTSEDVKFAFERIKDPALAAQWINYAQMMTRIETPDPMTAVIRFDGPRRSAFDAIASSFLPDRETADGLKDGKAIVGTGPFKVKGWAPTQGLTLERFAGYRTAGLPYLEGVKVEVSPDTQSALINLESGGLDWVTGVEAQDARRMAKDKAYQVLVSAVGSNFLYVGVDIAVPALKDKRVRQALAHAIDRKRMVETVLYDYGRPASLLWPRASLAYDAAQDGTYTYDPAKAKSLLQAAGWAENTELTMTLSSQFPPTLSMAEIYQQDLQKIGVRLKLDKLEFAVYQSRRQKGEFNGLWMAPIGYMHLSPATLFLTAFPVRLPNPSHFDTPRYRQLIDIPLAEADEGKLKAALKELNQLVLDEAFIIPIAENHSGSWGFSVLRDKVKGAAADALGYVAYENTWLSG